MKIALKFSLTYFIFGLIGGVFYREFSKFYGYTGKTMLSVLHTHLLILGAALFLILAIILKENKSVKPKRFKCFLYIYNISLVLFSVMLLTRGILEVVNYNLPEKINSMISGIAGITHIGLTIGLCLLIPIIRDCFKFRDN